MMMLSSTSEVMDALGGNGAVAKLTGRTNKAVWNWRVSETFPSKTYVVMTDALRAIGKSAPDSLWGMKAASSEPERAA